MVSNDTALKRCRKVSRSMGLIFLRGDLLFMATSRSLRKDTQGELKTFPMDADCYFVPREYA